MQIVPYQENYQEKWDNFVWQSNNGTLFHTRRFLSYHPPNRFRDFSLMFFENGKLLSLFPAALKEEGKGQALVSHPGASYGGFVIGREINLRLAHDLVGNLLQFARQEGIKRIEMTLPPLIYLEKMTHYLDFALIRQGFTYKKREVSSFITLDFPPQDALSTFKSEARTATRKAMKMGVQVQPSEDFATFYEILQKNLRMRHNVRPTHTLEELLRLKKIYPERIQLYGAFVEGQMVAGVVMFHCNRRVTLAFYISHRDEYQNHRAVNLLFYHIIQESIALGFRYLDFGIFTVNMEPNWGLARFKESFGAKGIFRDTFIKIL